MDQYRLTEFNFLEADRDPFAKSHMTKSTCRLRAKPASSAFCLLLSAFCFLLPVALWGQVETIEGGQPAQFTWVSGGVWRGTWRCTILPQELFSPDSSTLAVVSEEKIVLLGVKDGSIRKVLKIHVPSLADLNIQSANFLAMNQLFLLFTGVVSVKGKGGADRRHFSASSGTRLETGRPALWSRSVAVADSRPSWTPGPWKIWCSTKPEPLSFGIRVRTVGASSPSRT